MAGNVVIEAYVAENIKVAKVMSKEKIDGIVASIMALDRCFRNKGEPQGSIYDERGLLVFNKKARDQCFWQNVYYIKFAKFIQFAS